MKVALVTALIIIFCSLNGGAQTCRQMLLAANGAYDKAQYGDAVRKYIAAKNCDPGLSAEADKKIFEVFKTIEALKNEAVVAKNKAQAAYKELEKINEEKRKQQLELEDKNNQAFIDFGNVFRAENRSWFSKISDNEQNEILKNMYGQHKQLNDSQYAQLVSGSSLSYMAIGTKKIITTYEKKVSSYVPKVLSNGMESALNDDGSLDLMGFSYLDMLSYGAWQQVSDAQAITGNLPDSRIRQMTRLIYDSVKDHLDTIARSFLMPDTVIDIHSPRFFFAKTADFIITSYTSDYDYRKLMMRSDTIWFNPLSVKSQNTSLSDSGRLNLILALSNDRRYSICKLYSYALKASKAGFSYRDTLQPPNMYLFKAGRAVKDLSAYGNYFFSSDSRYLALFEAGTSRIALLNLDEDKINILSNSEKSGVLSLHPSRHEIAYFDRNEGNIVVADFSGRMFQAFPLKQWGISGMTNFDFAGSGNYLKIETEDSVYLIDLPKAKVVKVFPATLVYDLIVSPDDKSVLLTCYTKFEVSDRNYKDYVTLLTTPAFRSADVLYSGCNKFLFSGDGRYIIGYDTKKLMRWDSEKFYKQVHLQYRSCLGRKELIDAKTLSRDYYANEHNQEIIEEGARYFKDLAAEQSDTVLRKYYYRVAQTLFRRLFDTADSKVSGIRYEHIPFYYDWYNWIDNKLNKRNFQEQIFRQKKAVAIFDNLVRSEDSVYPEQLFYAANGYKILRQLYDSVGNYHEEYLALVMRELGLRFAVFNKDPANDANIGFMYDAFARFSFIHDTLSRGLDPDKIIALYEAGYTYLNSQVPPKILNVVRKYPVYYSNLRRMATAWLHKYGLSVGGNPQAAEQCISYAQEGLKLCKYEDDSLRFAVILANLNLLQNNRSLAFAGYDKVLNQKDVQFDIGAQKTTDPLTKTGLSGKEYLLFELRRLKKLGINSENIRAAEQYIIDKGE